MEGDLQVIPSTLRKRVEVEQITPLLLMELSAFSDIDWFLQPGSGKGVCPDKSPIEAGDACTTVNKGVGVNGFQGVHWFNKLHRYLHRWGGFYMDHSKLYTRENLH